MGKLNILHHKEWHVYSHDNRNKVIKDEKIAKSIADFEEEKRLEIEAEKRLLKLKKKQTTSKNDVSKPKHINFFEEAEKYQNSELVETEAAAAQRKKEERYTCYLGETYDGKKAEPWYARSSSTVAQSKYQTEETKVKMDRSCKQRDDPISSFPSSDSKVVKKTSAKATTIEDLRKERLKRERIERERLEAILNPPKQIHESNAKFYHSQYNREYVRRKE